MLDLGYDVEIVSVGDAIKIEGDKSYDPRIRITYKKSTISILWYLWQNRESIIYANTFILPSLLVGMIGKKTVFFSHDPVFPWKFSPYSKIKNLIVKFCYRFFTKIRVINEYEKSLLQKEGFWDKWIVIPLVISENNLKEDISPEPNILLLWHIVFPKKNPETMIRAIEMVLKKYPDIKIYQVGDNAISRNSEGKSFEELITELWIRDNFVLLWRRKESLVELELPTSIYLNSSLMEGQCIAVYDASMLWNALCLPSMSSFLGIMDGKVMYHDTFDYIKLAKNIIWYIEHPEVRKQHIVDNRKWIRDHHNFEFIQKRIQDEFSSL
jgi:glycosyltransferase involved in cell wall biosynthesis